MAATHAPQLSPLRAAVALQWRVIFALILREMRTRFGKSRIGYVWAFIEPIAQMMILAIIFNTIRIRTPALGTSLELFFLTGLIPLFMTIKTAAKVMGAADANKALLQYPIVKPFDVMVARGILEIATFFLVGAFLLAVLAILDFDVVPDDSLQMIGGLAMGAYLGFSFGVLSAAILSVVPMWSTVMGWINRAMFMTGGIFFLVEDLPAFARDIVAWNPLAHVIACVRSGFYPGYQSDVLDVGYVLLFATCALAAGLLGERALRRQIEE